MNTPRDWQPIPRRQLSRGGPRRRDAMLGMRVIAGLALAGSIGWLGWSLLRPLPAPSPASLRPLAQLPALPSAPGALDSRRTTVAALSADNIFAHARKTWETEAAAPTEAAPSEPEQSVAKDRGAKPREKAAKHRELPDEIRKSLDGLALKQIYTLRDGELVARISLIKSAEPEATIPLRVSEEFKDAPNAASAWKLVAIDRVANRVTLERSGHRVSLSVFSAEPVEEPDEQPRAAALAPPSVTPGVPEVEKRSREEIIAELRAAKVAEADIAALVALLDEHPELVEAAPSVDVTPSAAPAQGRTPPPGLEGVLRMMGQQQKKAADKAPAASANPSN